MGFSQALSGLSAQDENLKIISNNIANSQTVGFKSSKASFADVFAGANSRVGLGTSIAAVRQDFTSGDLENTGRNLDLAIAGDGFYRLEKPTGEIVFSRNGQFSQDANGFLVNANGMRLTGYGLSDANDPFSEVVAGGAPQAIRIPGNDIPASATTEASATFNFDASIDPADASLLQRASILTDPNDPDSVQEVPYHFASSFTTYDSLGNERIVTTYYRKMDDANNWQAQVALDGVIEDFSLVAQGTGDLDRAGWEEALVALDADSLSGAAINAGFTSTLISNILSAVTVQNDEGEDVLSEEALSGIDFGDNETPLDLASFSAFLNGLDPDRLKAVVDSINIDDLDVQELVLEIEESVEEEDFLTALGSAFGNAVFNDEYDFNQVAKLGQNAFRISFDNNGQLIRNNQGEVNAVTMLSVDGEAVPGAPTSAALFQFDVPGGADRLEFSLDILGSTQFNNNSVQNSLTQNGYTSGTLVGIEVLDNGTVVRNYTNEQTREAGQIVLGTFANMEGLQPEGDNAWRPTNESGEPVLGIAGTGMFGTIASGVLENSNVDLARELVNMIVAQRAYQANSSSIGTRDELLQTVINL
ncbi:flagellar hook protein FlgE [Halomonas mongoliensis]|uniref:flagellar hook protein FlgE n=1 Tax=Halomonas mongoliensis TaxID=321265 RepID=UPI00403AA884